MRHRTVSLSLTGTVLCTLGAMGIGCSIDATSPVSGMSARRRTRALSTSPLHSFSNSATNAAGAAPGVLVASGSTLYGSAYFGGAHGGGAVFRINADGSGFTLLHSFDGGSADGIQPTALILNGSTLYGTTSYGGGVNNAGTVFKMNTDGSGFAVLHTFTGSATDGAQPMGALTISGTTLYGMTTFGGTANLGVVFKLTTDGSAFSLLHSFAGGESDGRQPNGSLVLSGSKLYGMTPRGGATGVGNGVVFTINTNGTAFTVLHTFAGAPIDGDSPAGSLVLSPNATLYGTTMFGGASARGTVFKLDASGFSLLHSFAGGAGDGEEPVGSLTLSGSTLYGMTQLGGASNFGVVFAVDTAGSGFNVLHSFAGGASDGAQPIGTLALLQSTLYGMTLIGGANGVGMIFRMGTGTCAGNHYVSNHACVACAAGSTRAPGDDPAGADTKCTATLCPENQYVSNHTCVPCAPGSVHPAGGDTTGADTQCKRIPCAVNHYVSNHACVACAAGSTRAAGDDPEVNRPGFPGGSIC